MRTTDKPKFLEVLAGVHDFYGRELSSFAGQVWLEAMQSFDIEQITAAFSAHLMDAERGQFMPKPADIVRNLSGTSHDRSLIAWGKVVDAMQRVGAYQSVVFDDGAIHAAITDIGAVRISVCRSSPEEMWITRPVAIKLKSHKPQHESSARIRPPNSSCAVISGRPRRTHST